MGIVCKVCSLKYVSVLKYFFWLRPEVPEVGISLIFESKVSWLSKEGPKHAIKIVFCRDCWAGL